MVGDRKLNIDAALLSDNELVQLNWISTNNQIFEINRRLLPMYYKEIDKQKDETNLEKTNEPIEIEAENSYLSHACNLFKIHFYFILRYNHYNTYSK